MGTGNNNNALRSWQFVSNSWSVASFESARTGTYTVPALGDLDGDGTRTVLAWGLAWGLAWPHEQRPRPDR